MLKLFTFLCFFLCAQSLWAKDLVCFSEWPVYRIVYQTNQGLLEARTPKFSSRSGEKWIVAKNVFCRKDKNGAASVSVCDAMHGPDGGETLTLVFDAQKKLYHVRGQSFGPTGPGQSWKAFCNDQGEK